MADAVIALAEPIDWFGKTVDRLILREPRGRHLQKYGEPAVTVFVREGAATADREEAVKGYIDDLLTLDGKTPIDGGGSVLFGQLALADGIAVRDALFGFFTAARGARSTKSPTS